MKGRAVTILPISLSICPWLQRTIRESMAKCGQKVTRLASSGLCLLMQGYAIYSNNAILSKV